MRLLRTIMAGVLTLCGTLSFAQSAEEIVDKHTAAVGGKAVIESIKSQVTSSSISVMGTELTAKTTMVVGKGYRSEANFNGQDIIQCITPTGGWMVNPLAGQAEPVAMPETEVKNSQDVFAVGDPLYNYQQKGSKIVLDGRETVEGVNAFKLKLTNKEGHDTYFFIDPTTYYIVKIESTSDVAGTPVTATQIFSNFQKTKIGYVLPFTTVSNQGFEMTITVTAVEFNVDVDPKIFEMPK